MRCLTTLVILTGALLVAGLGAQIPGTPGQGASGARGLIVGRVVDAVSNAAIPSVIVSLAGAPLGSSIRVLTDSQGRFLFRNVPKGSFTLRATIGGSVSTTTWPGDSRRRSGRISTAATGSAGRAVCSSRSIWPTASRSPT